MLRRSVIRGLFFICLLTIYGCELRSSSGFGPGDRVPDFSLKDLDGATRSLADYRGKVTLVNFWASWCGPCIAEAPSLERLYSRLRPRGFEVIGVGIDDSIDNLRDFRQRFGLSFATVLDARGEMKRRYKVTGVPESFLIDAEGKLVLFIDPGAKNNAVTRIVGPREWDDPTMISRISAFLK